MIPLPTIDALDSITIPVACPVPWEAMCGDDRTRFCNQCSQNVHDVSELTRDEAVQLVIGSEKTPCLRLFRRSDGRVMTADCMTRRERAWKWLHRRSAWVAALFSLVFFGCERLTTTAGVPCQQFPDWATAHEEEHLAQTERALAHAPQDGGPVGEEKANAAAPGEDEPKR